MECKGERVCTCTICKGSGVDELSSYVKGVREAAGEDESNKSMVTVEDWDTGPRQVELFGEILAKYPVKAKENICMLCDGRGVNVCQNC